MARSNSSIPSNNQMAQAFERHMEYVEANLDLIAWQSGDRASLRDYLKIGNFFAQDLRDRPTQAEVVEAKSAKAAKAKANGNGRARRTVGASRQTGKRQPATRGGARKVKGATRSKPSTVKVPA